MTSTLKENYELKRVSKLKNRLTRIDNKIMIENKRDRLIYEAFDKQQSAAAFDIIKKLKTINFGALTSLAQARDAAIADVTKVLGGKNKNGPIRTIINLFKDEKENPLVDALAFSSALKNFFEIFAQYVTSLNPTDKNQTLGEFVTGQDQENIDFLQNTKTMNSDQKEKLADLQRVIIKGFSPEASGALAKLGQDWINKYLKGKKGLQLLAKDLMKTKINDLFAISSSVETSMKNVEAVGQAAAGAAQQGAVGSTGTTGTSSSGSSETSTGTSGTKSGATAPGAQVPNVGDEEKVKKMGEKLGPIIAAVKNNKFNLNLLAKKLVKAGLDPDRL